MSQFVTQPSGNLKPIWTFFIFQLSHFNNACAICDLKWLHTWMHFRFDPIYAHGSSGPQGIIWRCSEMRCSRVVSEFPMGTRYKKLEPSQGFAKAHRHPPPLCRCAWDSSLASHPRQSAPSWSGLPGPNCQRWLLRSTKNMMCKIHQNILTIPDHSTVFTLRGVEICWIPPTDVLCLCISMLCLCTSVSFCIHFCHDNVEVH